jgi:hypothetical protein
LNSLPNNLTYDGKISRVKTRVNCLNGWKGYYFCPQKDCVHGLTVTVNENGIGTPLIKIKKEHNCSTATPCSQLQVDARNQMAEMVKELAITEAATRAPTIALRVWKEFEIRYAGINIYLFLYTVPSHI